MTEQELDLFMRNVLLDAIALDEETNTETIPYTPSLHHQKQIKAMLKSPLRWARDRKQPVWKRALKRVAVILLVISLAFGSLMVISPTARATFIRWVTEWYETHIVAMLVMMFRARCHSMKSENCRTAFQRIPKKAFVLRVCPSIIMRTKTAKRLCLDIFICSKVL